MPEALRGGLPPVGSEEFCKALDDLSAWFAAAGNAVFDFLLTLTDPESLQAWADGQPEFGSATHPFGYLRDAVVWAVRQLATVASPVLNVLHGVVACVRDWAALVFGRCNTALLTGLWSLKAVLESLRTNRVGTDAGVWATVDLYLYLDPLGEVLEYLMRWACPRHCPEPGEALEAWRRGYITTEYRDCLLRLAGRDPAAFEPFIAAGSEQLSPREALQLVRRRGGTPEQELGALRNLGFTDAEVARGYQELYDELPTIADHLEWLRKNVFDDEYVRDFRLMDGFEERFWPKFGPDLRALGMKKENAALHYAAHWLNPSFTQLFEMTQRLRPGRVDPSLVFTEADLLRVMQEQDVGVYFRRRLEAVAHPAPNLTLVTRLFGLGVLTEADYKSRLQDLGYSEPDATLISSGIAPDIARVRAGYAHGWNATSVGAAYAAGQLTAAAARERLRPLGLKDSEIDSTLERAEYDKDRRFIQYAQQKATRGALTQLTAAYSVGALDLPAFLARLGESGVGRGVAELLAAGADAALSVGAARRRVRLVGHAVTKGKLTREQGAARLAALGIAEPRINYYLGEWSDALEVEPPQRSAAQVLRWVQQGLMGAATAGDRLRNLGWSQAEVTLALAGAEQAARRRQGQLASAEQRTERQAAAAAARVKREAERQAREAEAMVRRFTPAGRLQRWYALGVIDEAGMRAALSDGGTPPGDADRLVAEAKERKKSREERKSRKAAKEGAAGA